MPVPDEWKGSDLRSRAEVVRYLKQQGGVVDDPAGLVVSQIKADLGRGRSISQLLADMEADGMIRREVRGRRTFTITLVDDWGLGEATGPAPYKAAAGTPRQAPRRTQGAGPDDLADAVLDRALTAIRTEGELRDRIEELERRLAEAVTEAQAKADVMVRDRTQEAIDLVAK